MDMELELVDQTRPRTRFRRGTRIPRLTAAVNQIGVDLAAQWYPLGKERCCGCS